MEYDRDYYAILGIPSDADERSIKTAYRQLARRYHPDTSTDQDAVERFRRVQEAYELLIDSQQREAYDHWRVQQRLDHPLPLALRVTPSQETLACLTEPQLLYVLIEISASDEVQDQRLPLNLCLVLDRSTSMKGARLQQVKLAARYIVDQLAANDVFSLVTFSDRAEMALPGSRGINKAEARAAISGIRSGGGTELLQGLQRGLKEVEHWHDEGMHSHLILLTDGRTYGDDKGCLEAAKLAAEQNISLTLMGVGSDWNDKLLDEMARLSGSSSSAIYIDSNAKISKVFHEQIESLGSIFAHNLNLYIHFSEEAKPKEVFQVSPQITRLYLTDDRLLLGTLERQQPQALMMELLVQGRKPTTHRLLQVDVEGIVPALSRDPLRARQSLEVEFVTQLERRAPVPPDIVAAMGKLTIVKMQERAMGEIEEGQIEPAVNRLKTMATRLLDIGETELARAALLEAGRLAQTGSLSPEGQKKIRYGTRALRILPKEVRYD
jgi:Ca-activated chloride channel family protein